MLSFVSLFVQLRIAKVKRLHKPWTSSTYSVSSLYAVQFEQNYNLWHNIGVNIGDELIDKVTTFRTQKDAADYLKNWLQIRFKFLNLIWN